MPDFVQREDVREAVQVEIIIIKAHNGIYWRSTSNVLS